MDQGARISVLAISSCPEATRPWVEQYASGGFDIRYLETPCLAKDLKAVLDLWLAPAAEEDCSQQVGQWCSRF